MPIGKPATATAGLVFFLKWQDQSDAATLAIFPIFDLKNIPAEKQLHTLLSKSLCQG
jgi:hypothetical protein